MDEINWQTIFPFIVKCIFMLVAVAALIAHICETNNWNIYFWRKEDKSKVEQKSDNHDTLLDIEEKHHDEEKHHYDEKLQNQNEENSTHQNNNNKQKEDEETFGQLFLTLGGVFASIPFLAIGIEWCFGWLFRGIGGDVSLATTFFIATDMGGLQLSKTLADDINNWYVASIMGYFGGATLVFTIPIGFSMIDKQDKKYFASGLICGISCIPFAHIVTVCLLALMVSDVSSSIQVQAPLDHELNIDFATTFLSVIPITIFVIIILLFFLFKPEYTVIGFEWYGRILDIAIKIVFLVSIIEYFTSFFSRIYLGFGFDPILADSDDQVRALEVSGLIAMMLCGAMPAAFLLKKMCSPQMKKIGVYIGTEDDIGVLGLIASLSNTIVMFKYFERMKVKDKVLNSAFCVCAAFMIADHMTYALLFQPTCLGPLLIGKAFGGMISYILAKYIAVPIALKWQKEDQTLSVNDSAENDNK